MTAKKRANGQKHGQKKGKATKKVPVQERPKGNMQNLIELREYLDCESLSESLSLAANGSLSFHWANFCRTCEYLRNLVETSQRGKERLHGLTHQLEDLKNHPVWLRSRHKSIVTNLYELYASYMDPRLRVGWIKGNSDVLVSLGNEAGPYVTLEGLRWFDMEIYKKFILRKILMQDVPLRDFRLEALIPVECYFDKSGFERAGGALHQFSSTGFVLRLNGASVAEKLQHCQHFSIQVPVDFFIELREFEPDDLKEALKEVDLGNRQSYQLCYTYTVLGNYSKHSKSYNHMTRGPEHYIFVKYDDARPASSPCRPLDEILCPMVERFRDYILSTVKLAG